MSNIIDTRNMPIPLKLAAHRIKPITDMPQKIYVFNDPKSIGDLGFTRTDKQEDHEEYTLSSLCVPRSEYDKLKRHADRLADSVSFLLPMAKAHAFHNDVGSNVQICKDATDEIAEYRKETE